MRPHRVEAEIQLRGDVPGRHPLGGQLEDLDLPRRQPAHPLTFGLLLVAPAPEDAAQPMRLLLVDQLLPAMDPSHQLRDVGHGGHLGHVADGPGVVCAGLVDVFVVAGEDDEPGPRGDLPAGG